MQKYATGAGVTVALLDTGADLDYPQLVVRGFLADGQLCSDEDRTTITVESPALSCDDGKPIALVFEYTGGSCGDTTNPQEGKLECSGNPGSGSVSVSMQKMQIRSLSDQALSAQDNASRLRKRMARNSLQRRAYGSVANR